MKKIESAISINNNNCKALQKIMILFIVLGRKISIFEFGEIQIILICEYFQKNNLSIFSLSGFNIIEFFNNNFISTYTYYLRCLDYFYKISNNFFLFLMLFYQKNFNKIFYI